MTPIIIGVVVGVAVLGLILALIMYFRRQKARSEENKLRLTARMSGLEESEVRPPHRECLIMLYVH